MKGSCGDRFKSEFTKSKWSLQHYDQHEFYMCQWQNKENKYVHPAYLTYRVLFAIALTGMCLNSYIFGSAYGKPLNVKLKWFIYVTNWSYILITLQGILGAVIVIQKYVEHRKSKDSSHTNLNNVYWVLYGIALDCAPNVSLIYWGFVHDPKLYQVNFSNVSVHMLNTVAMVVDFWIVGFPTRFLHFYWTVIYALTYLIFNIVYVVTGGTDWFDNNYVYTILDWNSDVSQATVWTVSVLVFLVVFRFIFTCLHMLKENVYSVMYNKTNKVLPQP